MKNKRKNDSLDGTALAAGVSALLIVIIMGVLFINPWKNSVTNFEECVAAGGARLESYPEQCLYKGKTYTNESHIPKSGDDYIGLSENEALSKADELNVPARVVERDGEGLPTTMDFVFGRHNFYVKDGAVYKVETEGYAEDSPVQN